ncbi:hypothetical protein [Endozoicomonas sp. ALE010]|uniref:hypothetical protein n=1 Tax=Endozoicomonas sp. ALE010 TaxID=3403081 RepID=UPI003BB7F9BD
MINNLFSCIKNIYVRAISIWIAGILLSFVTKSALLSMITMFYTGILPFILVVLWLSNSETGIKLRSQTKKWHIGITISWFVFIYGIYARKWASSQINEIFLIDASNLGITYNTLALSFTPFGLIYNESVVPFLFNLLVYVAVLGAMIMPFLIVASKSTFKIISYCFVMVLLLSSFMGGIASLSFNKDLLIKQFALWADFDSNHLCTNEWARSTESVVFLGGDKVLVYQPENQKNSQFSVKTCNFEKVF